jgi:electron transfer flavoprotein beta subunit
VKIAVAIKSTAALGDEFELLAGGSGVDPADLEFALNEWDDFSLEAGLQLREQAGAGELVVITVGDDESDEALLTCLAKGADRAVRIWDDELTTRDPLVVARVLASALTNEAPDLILCGVQSSDAANGATGVALAAYLDLPYVAVVRHIDYDVEAGIATVERELEGGLLEVVRVSTPALLTIQTGLNEPRYANLRAIKQAREKPRAVLSLDDVGLDSGSLAKVASSHSRGLTPPVAAGRAEMLQGSTAEVAARIAQIVRERMAA